MSTYGGQRPWSGWNPDGTWVGAWPAPKPGTIPLRALGLGELFMGALAAFRYAAWPMVGVSAIVGLLVGLLEGPTVAATTASATSLTAETQAGPLFLQLVAVLVSSLGGVFAAGLIAQAGGRAALGRRSTLADCLTGMRGQLGALARYMGLMAGLAVVAGVVTVGVAAGLTFAVRSGGAGGVAAVVVGVIVLLGLVGVLVWINIALTFAIPVVVLEGGTAWAAIKRSIALVRGAFWHTFAVIFLASLVTSAVTTAPAMAFGIAIAFLGPSTAAMTIMLGVVTALSTAIMLPVTYGVTTTLYLDRRIRREGLAPVLAEAAARG